MSPLREFSRSLPMALLRAREAVMDRFRPLLRRQGVTEQQWRVLRALSTSTETSASSLAATTCIGLPSLSRILRTLEARGLIARHVKSTDQRTTLVSITPAGRRLLRKAGAESEERYQALATEMGPSNMRRLYGLLDQLAASRNGRDGPASQRHRPNGTRGTNDARRPEPASRPRAHRPATTGRRRNRSTS